MWVNARARNDYGLKEGVDYSLFQFPALGMGHDDTSSVDTKELNVTTNGTNPAAADAFLDFIISAEAADILAGLRLRFAEQRREQLAARSGSAGCDRGRRQLQGAVRPRRSASRRSRRRVPGAAAEVPAGSVRRQYRRGDCRDRGQGRRNSTDGRGRRSTVRQARVYASPPPRDCSCATIGESSLAARGLAAQRRAGRVAPHRAGADPVRDRGRLSADRYDPAELLRHQGPGAAEICRLRQLREAVRRSGLPQHADHDPHLHRRHHGHLRRRRLGCSPCSARSRRARRCPSA